MKPFLSKYEIFPLCVFHTEEVSSLITHFGNKSAISLKFNCRNIKVDNSKAVLLSLPLRKDNLSKQIIPPAASQSEFDTTRKEILFCSKSCVAGFHGRIYVDTSITCYIMRGCVLFTLC